MPHLDFRQAFLLPGEPAPTVVEPEATLSHSEADTPAKQKRALATRLPRLHRSDRTTILFAIFAFIGGLFCAFYFFNGGEFLRAAAAWSREFLYPRPSGFMDEKAKIDSNPVIDPLPAPSGDPRRAGGKSTSPFSSDPGSLYPPTFNNSSNADSAQATLPSGPGSLLNQLNIPPPGGDALLQSFNQGVDNMVRATNLFANSTATVVRTTVKRAPVKSAQLKSATQRAGNVAGNVSAKQNGRQTSRTLDRQTQAAASTVSTLDLRLLGGSAGLGGVGRGGSGGAVTGAMGGAMGAAGGTVGGLTGGR